MRSLAAAALGGTFGRRLMVLGSGTAISQSIVVLASPVLSRLYGPEDFGQLGVFLAFLSITAAGVTLRYEAAIVSAGDDREAALVVVLCALLLPVLSAVGTVVLALLVALSLAGFGQLPSLSVALAFPTLLLIGAFGITRQWLVRQHAFGLLARALVGQNATRMGAQIALGFTPLGGLALIVGETVGRFGGLLQSVRTTVKSTRLLAGSFGISDLRLVGVLHRRFPIFSLPSSFLDALGAALPAPALAHFYGVEAAGFFLLVQRVLSLPSGVLGASVSDVFYGRLADLSRVDQARARRLFRGTAVGLLAIGLPITVLVMVLGPPGFPLIFGAEWRVAGLMAAAVAPWSLAQLVVSPLSRAVYVYNGQALKMVYDLLSLATVLGGVAGSAAFGLDLVPAVWVVSLLQVGAYVVYLVILHSLVSRS